MVDVNMKLLTDGDGDAVDLDLDMDMDMDMNNGYMDNWL